MEILSALAKFERDRLEEWCRTRCLVAPVKDGVAMCRVLGTFPMYVDTTDMSVAPHLMMHGFWEIWISQFMAKTIKPGNRCIDVGANLGYFTLLMGLKAGSNGAIQAWEPQQDLANLIAGTAALNGLQVDLRRAVATDVTSCSLTMRTFPREGIGALRGSAAIGTGGPVENQITVNGYSIDSTEFAKQPVDFIKIDAEGHEPQVWAGCARVRKESPNLKFLIEFSPSGYSDAAGFVDQIAGDGWKLHTIDASGNPKPTTKEALMKLGGGFEMVYLCR